MTVNRGALTTQTSKCIARPIRKAEIQKTAGFIHLKQLQAAYMQDKTQAHTINDRLSK